MHRADGGEILRDNGFERSAALDDVALQSSYKTNIVGRIDKDLDVEQT